MRLIDADDLIAHTFKNDISYKAFVNLVKKQQTIEERKTGKWELDEEKSEETIEKIYICSACRNNEAWGETERTRYCSYCGAEMENWI